MRFKHIEPHRTFSTYILTEKARCIDFFHMSSGWFDWTEPSLTTSLQGIEGRQGANCTSWMRFKYSEPPRTRDGEYFAVAGVTKKIKVFEEQSVVRNASFTQHFPVHEMSCAAKLSCVAYKPYHKQQLHTNMQNGTEVRWQMGELLTALAEEETGEVPLGHPLGTWECTWITIGSPSFYLALSQVSALKCTIMTLSGTECTVPSALAHNKCTPYQLCTFLSSALSFYLATTDQHSA